MTNGWWWRATVTNASTSRRSQASKAALSSSGDGESSRVEPILEIVRQGFNELRVAHGLNGARHHGGFSSEPPSGDQVPAERCLESVKHSEFPEECGRYMVELAGGREALGIGLRARSAV